MGGGGVESAMCSNFKQTHMRAHLEKRITGEHFEPFPKLEGCNEVTNTKETIYKSFNITVQETKKTKN